MSNNGQQPSRNMKDMAASLRTDNLDDDQLEVFSYLIYHCGLGQASLADKLERMNADAATKAWNRKRISEDVHMLLKREQGRRARADRASRFAESGGLSDR